MCGRYARFVASDEVYTRFRVPVPTAAAPEIEASWNVVPQTMQPVIRLNLHHQREVVLMRWGLAPYFSKRPSTYSTVNVPAEDVLAKKAFCEPIRRRRCLVPVNCYFEWQVLDLSEEKKQPWRVGLASGAPFALAGIWDRWDDPNSGERLESYAIVTCTPSEKLKSLHSRMPVILHVANYDRWLEPGDSENPPLDLLVPYPSELTNACRIKPDVGNVNNNRPDLIDSIDLDDE